MTATIPANTPKPLDVGTGVVAASFGGAGCWLSVGRPHLRHGFVELTALPEFDELWRGDPAAVRRYRNLMADERFAFLNLDLPGEIVSARRAGLDDSGRPVWLRTGDSWTSFSTAWGEPGESVLVQRHVITWRDRPRDDAGLRFRGGLALNVMSEITDVSPVLQPAVATQVRAQGAVLQVTAPRLNARAVINAGVQPQRSGHWWCDPATGAHFTVRPDGRGPARTVVSVSVALAVGESGAVEEEAGRDC